MDVGAELPGILGWALDGLDRLTKAGALTEPPSSAEAVTALRKSGARSPIPGAWLMIWAPRPARITIGARRLATISLTFGDAHTVT